MQCDRLGHVKRFYDMVCHMKEAVGGARRFSECTADMDWPPRGVYFIQQPGEIRNATGEGSRIVRVGTHALKPGSRATLWDRLRQHKGNPLDGGGNHRGSIFRSLVGNAVINSESVPYPTWGQGNTAERKVRESERPIERAVSALIGEMTVVWLAIPDEPGPDSLRGYIEENAIALLSNFGRDKIDPPTPSWLGYGCGRKLVTESGLWNSRHVKQDYDDNFLDSMEKMVYN